MENKEETQKLYMLTAHTNAKFALRQVNAARTKLDGTTADSPEIKTKQELYAKTGKFIIDAVKAIENSETIDEKAYLELLDGGGKLMEKILNESLIAKKGEESRQPDEELLEAAKFVGAMGLRLSEKKLDLGKREYLFSWDDVSEAGLSNLLKYAVSGAGKISKIEKDDDENMLRIFGEKNEAFIVKLDDEKTKADRATIVAADGITDELTVGVEDGKTKIYKEILPPRFVQFKAFGDACTLWHSKLKNGEVKGRLNPKEFMEAYHVAFYNIVKDMARFKGGVASVRNNGEIDAADGAYYTLADAMEHVNSRLKVETKKEKIELYEKSAKLIEEVADTMMSDDPLWSSERLFGDEVTAFEGGRPSDGKLEETLRWEIKAIAGKYEAYNKLMEKIEALSDEMVFEGDRYMLADGHIIDNLEKFENLAKQVESLSSVMWLSQFKVSEASYSELDKDGVDKCIGEAKKLEEKFVNYHAFINTSIGISNYLTRIRKIDREMKKANPEFDKPKHAIAREEFGAWYSDILQIQKKERNVAEKVDQYVEGKVSKYAIEKFSGGK